MKNNKEYKITKASYSRLIGATFECVIINKTVNKPPIWFQEFEKRNDARWAKQEEFNKYVGDFINQQVEFNKQQSEFNNRVNNFMEQQVGFNKQQTEFNKHVLNVFKRNDLK